MPLNHLIVAAIASGTLIAIQEYIEKKKQDRGWEALLTSKKKPNWTRRIIIVEGVMSLSFLISDIVSEISW